MSEALSHLLSAIRQMMQSADIDYALLCQQKIDSDWFAHYDQQRIVNSFLFNYIKVQDKIGSKLFRLVLQHWREDETDAITMLDILHRFERLNIIESVEEWDMLREIRNAITHEYPEETQTRIDNIQLALNGYIKLKKIIDNIEKAL
jgi:hypothetical protein